MLTLTIQHSIYLTRDQRYSLHNGLDVNTVGVSLPVWHRRSKTSEPGREVFCNYYLRNPHKEIPIRILQNGYLICLPFRIPQTPHRAITNEEWMAMTQEQREAYYTSTPRSMSSASLLDVAEGGSESLIYREQNKVKSKLDYLRIIHYVNVFDVNYLERSLYEQASEESAEESAEEGDEGEDNQVPGQEGDEDNQDGDEEVST